MPGLPQRQWVAIAVAAAVVAAVVVTALALTGDGDEVATEEGTTTTRTTTSSEAPEPEEQVWPLTGVPLDGRQEQRQARRPALVVKIDNGDPRSGGPGARPQAGINDADVVFEEMVEGSVTRFAAVFHSSGADPVGPVRSARTTDLLIMASLNQPLFAWSGANAGVAAQVRESPIVDVGFEAAPDRYARVGDRVAPYNLLTSTGALREAAPEEDRPPPPLFRYRDRGDEPPGGEEVGGVHIVFGDGPGSAPVDFEWDGSGWARSQRDTPHVDAAGERIAPPNVVIRFAPYHEVQCCDASGFPIVEAELEGEGDAWILTGGVRIQGRWAQPELAQPAELTDADGEPVELTPGSTWVAIAAPGTAELR
jgi:hypothetical protein